MGLKSKLAIHFGGKCSVKLKFFCKMQGDFEDKCVEGRLKGLSLSVNDGHIMLRRRSMYEPTSFPQEHAPMEFVGSSLEQEYAPPRFRVRGKQGFESGQGWSV